MHTCAPMLTLSVIAATIATRGWSRQGTRLIRTSEIIEESPVREEMAAEGDERIERLTADMELVKEQLVNLTTLLQQAIPPQVVPPQANPSQAGPSQAGPPEAGANPPDSSKFRASQHAAHEWDEIFDDVEGYLDQMRAKRKQSEEVPQKQEGEESKIAELSQKLEKVTQSIKGKDDVFDVDELLSEEALPAKFRMPDLVRFDGSGDLECIFANMLSP